MGEMIALLRVMPTGTEVDLVKLEANLREAIKPPVRCERVEVKPIAFGLKALNVTVRAEDDGSGAIDRLEEALAMVPDVESVQVTDAGRL